MLETTRLVLTQFTDEAIVISSLIVFFFITSIILYWLCSKKNTKGFPHKLPASVVGNYVDNAMANAESLNSFANSGGKASVVSPRNLKGGAGTQGISSEEFNQKIAEIASLKHSIKDMQGQIEDFKKNISGQPNVGGGLSIAQAMRDKFTSFVKGSGKDTDPAMEKKFIKANKENEQYKKKLKEYELISDDIASLEKIKKENKKLKQTLKGKDDDKSKQVVKGEKEDEESKKVQGGDEKENSLLSLVKDKSTEKEEVTVIKGDEEETTQDEQNTNQGIIDDMDSSKNENNKEPKASSEKEDSSSNDVEQKATEDLLSEFEKMLG